MIRNIDKQERQMKTPAHDYAFRGRKPKKISELTLPERAMANIAWLADNFNYSNYEQAQKIAREVIEFLWEAELWER
jgi:hypothetical protein